MVSGPAVPLLNAESRREPPKLILTDKATGRELKLWGGRRMRTLADALEKLHSIGSLSEDGHVDIRTMPMRLPDGDVTSCVSVLTSDPFGCGVMMPSSASYRATTTLGQRCRYNIVSLDGATSDALGNVELKGGAYVHNVELLPTKLHYQLTPVQEEIVRLTISFMDAEERCYRYLDATALPGIRALDFSVLSTLTPPRLKAIERNVTRDLSTISRFKIATALARAGLRVPRSRRRVA